MRRIPIRVKLAGALAIPLLAMGVVTIVEVVTAARDARDVREQAQLATATIGPNGLITALQNERNWVSAYLVGVHEQLEMDVVGFDATRADTDAALAEFEQELRDRGEAASAAYAPALGALAGLRELRTGIDAEVEAATSLDFDNIELTTRMFDDYTALIEPFFGSMSRISIAMQDPQLRQGAELMETVTRQLETVPQLANAIAMPATVSTVEGDEAGINSPHEVSEIAGLRDAFVRQAEVLRTASGPYADIAEQEYPVEFTQTLDDLATKAVADSLTVDELISGLRSPEVGLAYVSYRDALADALEDRADELTASATNRQRQFAVLMVVTFLGALALTVLVSLSITRPLRSLMRQAKDMAERRLPRGVAEILDTPLGDDVVMPTIAPVQVATRDEVADVAEALNTVQDSALDLAIEQAVLRRNIADSFVNLGRRNQNLLGRQLDFITELESKETDPDSLASLFRLDHLATRMRRNAESLLVLAGIEPPRQWTAPVRLADVIRAALGEVENYQRVTVRGVEAATIVGSAAADLAHLMAELIENALVFSPPEQTVEIRGRRRPASAAGHDGGYTLAIVDSGLGMPANDIEAANRRLAGAESFTIAPSKYLGHYVAGNLAARHGIGVHVNSSPGSGITATVEVPASLLTPDADDAGARFEQPPDRRSLAAAAPAAIGGPATAGRPPGGLPARVAPDHGAAPAAASRGVQMPTDAQISSLSHLTGRARTTGQHPVVPAAPAEPSPTAPWYGSQLPGPAPAHSPFPGPAQAPNPFPGPAQAPNPFHAPPLPSPGAGAPPPLARRDAGAPPPLARRDDTTPPPLAHREGGAPPPLARRDRGAQMPTTTPLRLHRTPPGGGGQPGSAQPGPAQPGPAQPSSAQPRPAQAGPAWSDALGPLSGAGPGPGGPGGPPGRTSPTGGTSLPGGTSPRRGPTGSSPAVQPPTAAAEVYGFLSSFTAGVQRGLEAARSTRGDIP